MVVFIIISDRPTFGIAETGRTDIFGLSLPKLPNRTDLQNQRLKIVFPQNIIVEVQFKNFAFTKYNCGSTI